MTEMKWEQPGDRRRAAPQDYTEKASALKANPGRWALIADGLSASRTQASSAALAIRRGKYAAFKPAGEFEAKSSRDAVWARWVGPNREFADDKEPVIEKLDVV